MRYIVLPPKTRHDLYPLWDDQRKYVIGYFASYADARAKADKMNAAL